MPGPAPYCSRPMPDLTFILADGSELGFEAPEGVSLMQAATGYAIFTSQCIVAESIFLTRGAIKPASHLPISPIPARLYQFELSQKIQRYTFLQHIFKHGVELDVAVGVDDVTIFQHLHRGRTDTDAGISRLSRFWRH